MMDGDQLVSRKRHSGPDFISGLPLDIIHRILELVPIREAIRICILSRRWRYIWATLPNLDFKNENDPLEWKVLKTIITNVLLLHKGPIHKFSLASPLVPVNCPEVDHWLLCLSRNDIKDLFLHISRNGDRMFRVHSCLFSCQKLTHLKLDNCILPPPPPSFKGFSCLKSLALFGVKVPSDIVESLVSNSPLLENFSYYKRNDSALRIRAPNLKTAVLLGDLKEVDLNAPLMVSLSVPYCKLGFTTEQLLHKTSVCNLTKFLGCFTNLKMLRGSDYFTKYLSIGIESYDHSLAFHHLKIIDLNGVNFDCPKELLVVVHLIKGAPNLQKLNLETEDSLFAEDASEAPPMSFGCTFNTLRDINFRNFRGVRSEVELIKFLLRSSTVLKMMTLYCSHHLLPEVKSSLMTELLRCSRASPNAEILFS